MKIEKIVRVLLLLSLLAVCALGATARPLQKQAAQEEALPVGGQDGPLIAVATRPKDQRPVNKVVLCVWSWLKQLQVFVNISTGDWFNWDTLFFIARAAVSGTTACDENFKNELGKKSESCQKSVKEFFKNFGELPWKVMTHESNGVHDLMNSAHESANQSYDKCSSAEDKKDPLLTQILSHREGLSEDAAQVPFKGKVNKDDQSVQHSSANHSDKEEESSVSSKKKNSHKAGLEQENSAVPFKGKVNKDNQTLPHTTSNDNAPEESSKSSKKNNSHKQGLIEQDEAPVKFKGRVNRDDQSLVDPSNASAEKPTEHKPTDHTTTDHTPTEHKPTDQKKSDDHKKSDEHHTTQNQTAQKKTKNHQPVPPEESNESSNGKHH